MPPTIVSSSDKEAISSTCATHGITSAEFALVAESAKAAKATAYCPYSKFRVGAAILTAQKEDGSASAIVTGCNVENASFPVGTCAERVALGRAVAEGYRGGFRAIGVATDISPPASPCGMCRQFIREFLVLGAPIIMFDKNMDFVVMTLEELLPMSFGPDQLPPPTV